MTPTHPIRWPMLGLALALSWPAAQADDEREGAAGRRTPLLPLYQQECGSCHVAYPPRLLPATSWRALTQGLSKHFGTDASVDQATAKTLGDWLAAHAGTGQAPPEHRITRSRWFTHEHDEVAPSTWQAPGVKRAANCAACHTQADQGDFHERHIRIPR